MKSRRLRVSLSGQRILMLSLLLGACTGDGVEPGLASIELTPHSGVHFPAIGDTLQLAVSAVNQDGESVFLGGIELVTRNSSVATVNVRGVVQGTGDGETYIVALVDGAADSVRVTVAQARDSLVLALPTQQPIVSLASGASFPLSCRVFDSTGTMVPLPATVTSAQGRVTGTECGNLTAINSGYDTLTVQSGTHLAALPVVIAILPVVTSNPSDRFPVDSIPTGASPWAPTLVKNSRGEFDLYFAAYHELPLGLGTRGDLHRLVSSNGRIFRYDGLVLRRDPAFCSPQGTGIENVAVVPRAEGGGWRMFFSAGSYDCYGWQVFSAVSDDERHWVKETGPRIPNGGVLPPAESKQPPWPTGEGMVVERLPSGQWQMLVGAYEHLEPPENRFQITAWHSSDQLLWSYSGPVLTTRQVGPGARRSVYSPTLQQLAPGLTRMFFTGDNLDVKGGRSRIYSAVSLDGNSWQVEGVVLGDRATDYFYSTLVDDLLVFIRSVSGSNSLGSVRIRTQ